MQNKQLVITAFDKEIEKACQIIEINIPLLQPNEVLIKNKIVGINAVYDRELYNGRIPYIEVTFPFVFGVEAVGEIIDKGANVTMLNIGDAVSTVKVGTAYQTHQILNEKEVIPIPNASPEYLTLNPTGVSAFLALEKVAELKQGETIVISAAAGGLGHLLVQLAAKRQAKIIAICGSDEKVALLNSLQCCYRIINYRKESIEEVLNEECRNGIDVAIDSVGKELFDVMLNNLAPLGRLVVIGLAAELENVSFEVITAPRVYEKIYWKGASVRCFMNHLYKAEHARARKILFEMYQEDKLEVKVDQTSFNGLESIIPASKYLLSGRSCGKVIVKL